MTAVAQVRRLAPPDRRSPTLIAAGECPQHGSCYCCPLAAGSHRDCRRPHPPADRLCSQPYPASIPACPEQTSLPQVRPVGCPTSFACCVECGRVTCRRWTDDLGRVVPWCAGLFPDPSA